MFNNFSAILFLFSLVIAAQQAAAQLGVCNPLPVTLFTQGSVFNKTMVASPSNLTTCRPDGSVMGLCDKEFNLGMFEMTTILGKTIGTCYKTYSAKTPNNLPMLNGCIYNANGVTMQVECDNTTTGLKLISYEGSVMKMTSKCVCPGVVCSSSTTCPPGTTSSASPLTIMGLVHVMVVAIAVIGATGLFSFC